jgi:Ca2+-binding EF-hand superfamily protein
LLAVEKDDPRVRFRAAKAFYIAQFKAAAGNEPALKAAFADDPTAQVLSGLFDAADRNEDGKLTRAELEAFFDLIELGITCRIIVTATDRGRNLFDAFDADGDGRLDLGELVRASRSLVTTLRQQKGLPRGKVPASYRLLVSREVGCDAFGPVPFGANANPKAPTARNRRGPKWFQAQDQNGDGFISPREFVGPPHLFAKLDADGDGRISVAEAEAAGR